MKRTLVVLAVVLTACTFVSLVRADNFNASDWGLGYSDPSGNFIPQTSPPYAPTVSGGVLSAPIPTHASQSALVADDENPNYYGDDPDVDNYLFTASADYNGSLTGNLLGKVSVSATFNLSDSALLAGAAFTPSELVGESTSDTLPDNTALRFVFFGTAPDLTDDPSGQTPSIWWSNPTAAFITSLNNGQDVTLTADFLPSQWSNIYGHAGNASSQYTSDFYTALSDVSAFGFSFGSGYFFADGFAFNTGGEASINVDSFATSVPLPASIWGGGLLMTGLALWKLRQRRAQPA
jgi:hypothetical protein